MLEEILDIRNVQKAFRPRTCGANKGGGGIDGMQTDALRAYLNANWRTLREDILEGRYRVQAVRKVETKSTRRHENLRNTNGARQAVAASDKPVAKP